MNLYTLYSDLDLLLSLKKGDQKAFLELYERYAPKLRLVAYAKVQSKEITEEIIQEIFSDLWERRHSTEIQNISGYLNTSVKYQCINQLKKKICFEKYAAVFRALEQISEENTGEEVEYNDLNDALEAGMQKLPEKSQQVFRLSRLEGKSIGEISRKLNLSEKAIEYHLYKSVRELKVHLKDFILMAALLFV